MLLMLRSAIRRGVERHRLRYWIDRYENSGDSEVLMPVEEKLSRIADGLRPILQPRELQDLNQVRDLVTLDEKQLEQALRSVISAAHEEQRDDVRYWTRKFCRERGHRSRTCAIRSHGAVRSRDGRQGATFCTDASAPSPHQSGAGVGDQETCAGGERTTFSENPGIA